MGKKDEKTNVMRILEQKKTEYESILYETSVTNAGIIAEKLGEDPSSVFKTLVTVGKSREHYVFMIPANEELDLKKAALAAGEKSIEMIPQKELLPLTGYVHGGCSPIGMKKQFETFIDITASGKERICFSGGKVGFQVRVRYEDLKKVISITESDLVKHQ